MGCLYELVVFSTAAYTGRTIQLKGILWKRHCSRSGRDHWPWRSLQGWPWCTGSWSETHPMVWGLANADRCLVLSGFASVLSGTTVLFTLLQVTSSRLLWIATTPIAEHQGAGERLHVCTAAGPLLYIHWSTEASAWTQAFCSQVY